MTSEDILKLAQESDEFEKLLLEHNKVYFQVGFNHREDYEPGEVAWDLICDINDSIKSLGIRLDDTDSDNDTLWGYIVNIEDDK